MSRVGRITSIIMVIACITVGPLLAQPSSPQIEREATFVPQSQWKEKACLETREAGLAILCSLSGMRETSHKGMDATLFEAGKGGDPAMNGISLYLLIEEEDFRTGNSYLYDTELDVAQIEKFEFRGNSILLRVLEDAESREGDIVTYRVEYSFHFTVDREEHLKEKITIKRKMLGVAEE